MDKIIWNSHYETGIENIDFQHKILVERLNDIIELQAKGEVQSNLFELLVFLEGYANYHFQTEEMIFKSFPYSNALDHIATHNFFKKKIKDFKEKYSIGETLIDKELIEFLSKWLLDHILGTDKDMALEYTALLKGKR